VVSTQSTTRYKGMLFFFFFFFSSNLIKPILELKIIQQSEQRDTIFTQF
jgi:hypothetical protein